MPNPNPETSQLTPFKAPDTSGGLIFVGGKIEPSLKDWLKSLPGGTSYHVRQAVKLYWIWEQAKANNAQERGWDDFFEQCREAKLLD